MSANPTITTVDYTKDFKEIVARFKRDAVLIGIPSNDNEREDGESDEGEIGNAAILAINHFGSEEAHIPPRPVLAIGIKKAQPEIAEAFKKAAQDAFKSGAPSLVQSYERVGTIAANSCKRVINDQEGIQKPADSTLAGRKYLTKNGFKGTKALLVTGQLRNAITYVVNSIWGKG